MAINTIQQVIDGLKPNINAIKNGAATTASRFYSPFYVTGNPGAAPAPSVPFTGVALSGYTGQIPFSGSSTLNTYLANFTASVNTPGTLILCDRLWHNSMTAATSTTAHTINSATFPPRDLYGSTSGHGIMIGAEVSTVMGAGLPTFTMNYTNQAGVTSRVLITGAQPSAPAVGSFFPIPLGSGDTGVRSIQTWTQSQSYTSGVYHLVAYRELARINIKYAGETAKIDAITGGLPRLYNDTVPFLLWYPSTTTAPFISTVINYTQG